MTMKKGIGWKIDGMKICCSFESISDEDEGEIEVEGWWRFQWRWMGVERWTYESEKE